MTIVKTDKLRVYNGINDICWLCYIDQKNILNVGFK